MIFTLNDLRAWLTENINTNGLRAITGKRANDAFVNTIDSLVQVLNDNITSAISALVNGAPSDADTLKKLYDLINQLTLGDHYKGTYISLEILKLAIPTGEVGDEALIDAGVGSNVQKAIWDTTDNDWIIAEGGAISVDQIPTQSSINPVASGGVYNSLSNKVDKTQTVNNKQLTGNITITPEDISYVATGIANIKQALDSLFAAVNTTLPALMDTKDAAVITTLREGVPSAGNTLNKLYTLIQNAVQAAHFKGTFVSLDALKAAIPTSIAGDYATIEPGESLKAKTATFNVTNNTWEITGDGVLTIDAAPTSESTNPVSSGGAYMALNGKVDKTQTLNNKQLSGNVEITPEDILYTQTNIDNVKQALDALFTAINTTLPGLIDTKGSEVIATLRDSVPSTGDTLNKLYNLIINSFSEISVADITARNALNITAGNHVFVSDDGDGKWALYKATTSGINATYIKLSDPDLLNAVMSASQIKAAYESNDDTNAFTDSLLSKLNAITGNNTGDETQSSILTKIGYTPENTNTIKEPFVFLALSPDYGVVTRNVNFRINSISAASGLTVTIKTSSDADYTLGATVTANDYLKVYGNTLNKAATLIGEVLP